MFELTDEAEAALAYVMLHRLGLPESFDDSIQPSHPFIELRDAGFIKMETDMSQKLVMLFDVLPPGIDHYQRVLSARRGFVPLEETANELLSFIAANRNLRKAGRRNNLFNEDSNRVEDFQSLSRLGLLNVQWADDIAYAYEITEKGLSYIKGWFKEESPLVNVSIENNPTIQGAVSNSESNATSNSNVQITLRMVLQDIKASEVDEEVKRNAEDAVLLLDEATEERNITKFAEGLEKVASVVKSATSLGATLLPYISQLISHFGF